MRCVSNVASAPIVIANVSVYLQATRGGRVKLATLTAPDTDYNHPEKGDALHAMEIALALEKLNFQYLYKLQKVRDRCLGAGGIFLYLFHLLCTSFSGLG